MDHQWMNGAIEHVKGCGTCILHPRSQHHQREKSTSQDLTHHSTPQYTAVHHSTDPSKPRPTVVWKASTHKVPPRAEKMVEPTLPSRRHGANPPPLPGASGHKSHDVVVRAARRPFRAELSRPRATNTHLLAATPSIYTHYSPLQEISGNELSLTYSLPHSSLSQRSG
jgi:hypothetical protein